jgi:two-component sensor histidine kinase
MLQSMGGHRTAAEVHPPDLDGFWTAREATGDPVVRSQRGVA